MRIKITDNKYEILVRALDYAHDNTEVNSFEMLFGSKRWRTLSKNTIRVYLDELETY